ncbi:O-antigen ligase family protein [Sulfuricurvum sp.]|uniref:O-antigen ligase family protein n=1 Tax=Sulfuricurvum sp. TaxID=2025608 RepID=UPI00260DF859|nr:O-antigen ligase family protein [Sulfuricurvum sp.]MDD3598342.1 O-antigen ligase family protein [Sulfuricurvum sp.]
MIKTAGQLNVEHYLNRNLTITVLVVVWIVTIPMKNAVFQLMLGLIPLSFFWIAFQNKDLISYITEQPFTKAILLFFGVISLANMDAFNPAEAWHFELRLLQLALCLYALVYFLKKKYVSISLIVISVLFAFGIQVIDGLFQYLYGQDLIGKTMLDGRMKAMVFHPNTLGLVLSVGIVLSAGILLHKRYFSISIFKAGILTLIVSMALFDLLQTNSRGSWVATVSALSVYFWIERKNLKSKHYIYVILGIVGLLIYASQDSHIVLRVYSLFQGESAGRDVLWSLTWHHIELHPFLGYGLDAFRFLPGVPSYGMMPHNIILEILLSTGMVGMVMFLFLWYRLYSKIVSYKEDTSPLYSSAIAILIVLFVSGMFDHSIYQNVIYDSIWIILIAIVYKR